MLDFVFNREDAGVTAKGDWNDAQTFSNIAAGAEELSNYPAGAIVPLPVPTVEGSGPTDNSGRDALKSETEYVVGLISDTLRELSEACYMLGSGVKTASSNFEAIEENVTERFAFLTGEVCS